MSKPSFIYADVVPIVLVASSNDFMFVYPEDSFANSGITSVGFN